MAFMAGMHLASNSQVVQPLLPVQCYWAASNRTNISVLDVMKGSDALCAFCTHTCKADLSGDYALLKPAQGFYCVPSCFCHLCKALLCA